MNLIPPLSADPSWLFVVDGYDPDREASVEAVLAIANGYVGTRAAVDEGGPHSRPATLIAGVFDTPALPQAPELESPVPELVVAPDWSRLRVLLGGGELRPAAADLRAMRRTLDMRQGLLLRRWRAGGVGLSSLRLASLGDRRALAQLVLVEPAADGEICLELSVDGQVTNANDTRHLAPVSCFPAAGGGVLVMRTIQSGYTIALASRAELVGPPPAGLRRELSFEAGRLTERISFSAQAGRAYLIHKLVALATSRDGADPAGMAAAHLADLRAGGVDRLLSDHIAAWAERWAGAGPEIPGDAEVQRQARFAVYHLIGAANPDDERASIGARALTGERYRGHVFWDTEIFAWPPLLYTHPASARALLMYRYHNLPGARAKAAAMGYAGALFPWESADTGEEVTPDSMLSGGARVPVLTGGEEHHIAADVAYAAAQYALATGDQAFRRGPGAAIMLDVARFWASRAEPDADGAFHIRRVIGPDEYHETVDDNAYTNGLAAWALRAAADLAEELGGAGAGEPARWRAVADGLVTGCDPASGLIEQFSGYHLLEPIDLGGHDTSIATVDARLGWYAMQRTRVLKQADALMLLILRWDSYPPAAHAANFAYYEPSTSHDSSLSLSFHALFAARLGRLDIAQAYLRRAALIDLDLGRRGHAGASDGVHIAAQGGIWQALALGFLGMRPAAEGLRFAPHVPAGWRSLTMPIAWRGSRLRVTAWPDGRVEATHEGGPPVRVALGANAAWSDCRL
ncbi:hypothetical protein K2Z83_06710 [Oscillochloris sp. ZM17-4]|uniref:glycosyl hydrolase family 65 protein n=1 Tax=Oscillochloris sp. ZM17-4 TaxID=2866714 RepID=UPI001C72B22D|nr:glycosyl hydrolase family 65 protein [Oscillochloris sp. ZM17-4]MBX0327366.1 hypothetical protein [Oscillochloris sp. ZM17-4]